MGLIPAWGRPLEKENGNPLQYSCLKKSHWQSLAFTVCGVTKSHTQLSNWCIHSRWRPFTSHEEDSHQKINLQKPWSWISNCHNTDKTNVYYLSSQSVIDISCHLKSSPEPLFRCQLFHLYPLNFPPITQTLKLMILYFIACFQLAKPSLFPILSLSEWHSLSYNVSQNPRIHSWHFFLPCASYSIHPSIVFYILQFSCSVMSDSLQPHEPQHARPPCPSPTPRVHPNPCPLCRWCHPTISSSVVPISSVFLKSVHISPFLFHTWPSQFSSVQHLSCVWLFATP